MNSKNPVLQPNSFWSPNKVLFFILLTIFVVPLSLDVFIVSLEGLQASFQVSQFKVSLVMGLWSAGVCLGQLIFGPLMDSIGRRKIFLFGMCLTAVSSFIALAVKHFDLILLLRFCHGFGVSAQILASRALIIDLFEDSKKQAKAFSLNIFFTLLGAFLAPLFAGFMVTNFGWRSLFISLGLVSSFISFMIILGFPETLVPEKRHPVDFSSQIKSYLMLFSDRFYLGYSLVGALAFFWIFAHFVGASYLFKNIFAFTTQQFSWFLAANMLFGISSSLINRYLLHFYSVDQLLRRGELAFILHVTSLLVLALLGFNHPWLFMVNIFLGNMSITFLTTNSMAAAVNRMQKKAGTASALYGIMQFGAGFIASALMGYLIDFFILIDRSQSLLPLPIFFFAVGILIVFCRLTLLRNTKNM